MPEQERPPYLPPLPERYPRTQYVPAEIPAQAYGSTSEGHTQTSRDELVVAAGAPPPVDAGRQSVPRPEGQTIGQQWVEVFQQARPESLPAPVDVQPPAPTGEAAAEPEARERERVQLAGRLGQDPRMRTTPKGTLIASFPLGVKDQANLDKTTWHTVLAFQKRAEQVRNSLKKGDPVEVIGYVHEREIPRRDGTIRTVHEVYATIIKQR